MSEEPKPTEGEEKNDTPDPIAEKAKASGWRPKEEFEGDPEQWVDAPEFLRRAPLYDKNRSLKREISELRSTLHELKQHVGKVAEAARNKAIAELTAKRDEAIEMGDKDQVKEIDKVIKETESTKVDTNEPHPAIKAWEAKNGEWFYADEEIANFGMAYAQNHLLRHPSDFEGAMSKMEEAIKKAYPDKFTKENLKRKEPPAVETGGKGDKSKTFTKSDLNDEQRKVMNKFVRQGIMSEEEYIKELADSGILGGKK